MSEDGNDVAHDWNMPDHALVNIVESINDELDLDASLGITLTVGGLVVTGDLIPAWRWFEELDEQTRPDDTSADEPRFLKDVASEYREHAEILAEAAKLPVAEHTDAHVQAESLVTHYLHLRNARFMSPFGGGGMPGDGCYWRGRLAECSGWTIGTLRRAESDTTATVRQTG